MYERDIWFWLDRQLQRSTPWVCAEQLCEVLRKAGLDARQGFFTDVPHRVDWPQQSGYQPVAEEGQGLQALVAIFTDGAGLARQLENPLTQYRTERLLTSLRHWPKLCFVDCAVGNSQLAALLEPYRLTVVSLQQLPQWLGGMELTPTMAKPLGDELLGDHRRWAASIAFGGSQASAADAQTLRVFLALSTDPWQVDAILSDNTDAKVRRRLINWLLRCEPREADGLLRPDSSAWQALDWWHRRYNEAAQEMRKQENGWCPGAVRSPAVAGAWSRRCCCYIPSRVKQPANWPHSPTMNCTMKLSNG